MSEGTTLGMKRRSVVAVAEKSLYLSWRLRKETRNEERGGMGRVAMLMMMRRRSMRLWL